MQPCAKETLIRLNIRKSTNSNLTWSNPQVHIQSHTHTHSYKHMQARTHIQLHTHARTHPRKLTHTHTTPHTLTRKFYGLYFFKVLHALVMFQMKIEEEWFDSAKVKTEWIEKNAVGLFLFFFGWSWNISAENAVDHDMTINFGRKQIHFLFFPKELGKFFLPNSIWMDCLRWSPLDLQPIGAKFTLTICLI